MHEPPAQVEAPKQRFYTASQTAEILQVSKRTVYRYIEEGQLKGTRFSEGVIRIAAEDLEAFIDSTREAS